ncbi:MAG: MBOAT family O-acyltransferase [Anaerolineae bacterium]|nr:MBOAT family O-acyltransferase [Anaerolineae bacterium]MDQ7036870.1 MBOAT family O-acyltransferase [Anaerolineae bacterium]
MSFISLEYILFFSIVVPIYFALPLLSGLWHGANWTFIIWGTLHGSYIVLESLYSDWQARPRIKETAVTRSLQRGLTFLLVVFAWIFFHANSVADAGFVLTHLFDFGDGRANLLRPLFNLAFDPRLIFIGLFALIGLLMTIEWSNTTLNLEKRLMQWFAVRWTLYYTGLACHDGFGRFHLYRCRYSAARVAFHELCLSPI